MLKKIIFTVILINIVTANHSQTLNDSINGYQIEFTKTLYPHSPEPFTSEYKLNYYTELSISIFDEIKTKNEGNILVNDEDDDETFTYNPKGKNLNLVYKDYTKNEMYSKDEIGFKWFTIKDSITLFNWDILNQKKIILGYNCQLAKTEFRGREYKAWFTTELPIGGPWKYDGLPGMILHIETNDKFIKFEATHIKNIKLAANKNIKKPLKQNNALSWNAFKKLYKQKAIALAKFKFEGEDTGIIIQRRGIERYIDENDTEYKADKVFEKKFDIKID